MSRVHRYVYRGGSRVDRTPSLFERQSTFTGEHSRSGAIYSSRNHTQYVVIPYRPHRRSRRCSEWRAESGCGACGESRLCYRCRNSDFKQCGRPSGSGRDPPERLAPAVQRARLFDSASCALRSQRRPFGARSGNSICDLYDHLSLIAFGGPSLSRSTTILCPDQSSWMGAFAPERHSELTGRAGTGGRLGQQRTYRRVAEWCKRDHQT